MLARVESGGVVRDDPSPKPTPRDAVVWTAVLGEALGKKDLHRFTEGDLFDGSGPKSADIRQDAVGDCYFVAALGAYAKQDPEVIDDSIRYDPETGNFTVRLYGDSGPVEIEVTQADIEDNLKRWGGSTVDNTANVDGPIWPAVIETARAKMLDSNPSDGLDEGYKDIEGGHSADAMFTLTGYKGDNTYILGTTLVDKLLPGEPLNDHVYDVVKGALDEGRAVTLDTSVIDTDDGLSGSHVYIVESIGKNEKGEIIVTLRNSWGNNGVGEGKAGEQEPLITVKLKDLSESGMAFTASDKEPDVLAPGPLQSRPHNERPGEAGVA